MNNTVVVVKTESVPSGQNTLMIAVVCSIIGVILIGGVSGYFLYRKYARNAIDKVDHTSHPVD